MKAEKASIESKSAHVQKQQSKALANKAAPRRIHQDSTIYQARASRAKDRLLEPPESPAWPWNRTQHT